MTQPAADSHALRLAATLEHWKSQLLDLTKRNRALNFRVQKVSTVTIVDEQPAEVYRQLVERGVGMRFVPVGGEGGGQRVAGGVAQTPPAALYPPPDVDDDSAPDPALSRDFAPYDPAELDARH